MFQRMFLMLGACALMVPSLATAADLPAPNPVVENAKRYDTNSLGGGICRRLWRIQLERCRGIIPVDIPRCDESCVDLV